MTWKQRKPFDLDKPAIKTSPKQALQREWFVRQGQILGGFHCMHIAARQLGNPYGQENMIDAARYYLIKANDEWFAREKEKLNETK